jgi:hypothetical protein
VKFVTAQVNCKAVILNVLALLTINELRSIKNVQGVSVKWVILQQNNVVKLPDSLTHPVQIM